MVHAVGSVRRINEDDAARLDTVAYSGTNHVGKIGVERYYESELLGEVGYQRVETDARGRVMKVLDSTPPEPGKNLVLHLDSDLQRAASEALGDRRGAIVARDRAEDRRNISAGQQTLLRPESICDGYRLRDLCFVARRPGCAAV
ncbi:MAG: hypothetical protein U5O39_03230 [Gammaproteobacteria bacterium]|nr:hypothetical protein [Gammaproteobacteria bacterium]